MASNPKETFKCDVCTKPCKTFRLYLKHVRLHTPKDLSKVWSRCSVCQQFFPTDFDRQSHGFKDHSEILKSIQCRYCSMEFGSNKEFFSHAQIAHPGDVQDKWLKCCKCSEFRPSRISLNVHLKNSHSIEEELVLKRQLKQIKCKYCPLIFSSSLEYKDHLDQSHAATQAEEPDCVEIVDEKSTSFECQFCIHEQHFERKQEYLKHVQDQHLSEAQSKGWKSCDQCKYCHLPSWKCVQDRQEAWRCLICPQTFEMAEDGYGHMDQAHAGHGLFSQSCDECSATRPDKTSLMLHKLTHLGTNSNGPKIKIITNSKTIKPPVTDNKILKTTLTDSKNCRVFKVTKDLICGICSYKTPYSNGSLFDHFKHAEHCMETRKTRLSCLYCPTINFDSWISLLNHCDKFHQVLRKDLSCIWCGEVYTSVDQNAKHLKECSKASKGVQLYQEKWKICEFCPTLFFFENLEQNPFYISHMNNFHQQKMESKWSEKCPICHTFLPTSQAAKIHQQACYKGVSCIKLYKRDLSLFLKSRRIPSNWAVPNVGLLPTEKITYQNCGLCCKRVSGRVKDHFMHARACYTSIVKVAKCLKCWHVQFFTNAEYLQHMLEIHKIETEVMLCVNCGITKQFYDTLVTHQLKCFKPLKEELMFSCQLCPFKFYFEQDYNHPFLIAHMNDQHPNQIPSSWELCPTCQLYVPDLDKHFDRTCLINLNKKPKEYHKRPSSTSCVGEIPPDAKKPKVYYVRTSNQPKLILPKIPGGISILAAAKVPEQIPEPKMVAKCGFCKMDYYGDKNELFAHSEICWAKKRSSILCPNCPQSCFGTKNVYAKHLLENHSLLGHNYLSKCIMCGLKLATWADLIAHQNRCFPPLKIDFFKQCQFCSMTFFLDATFNIFYLHHVNLDHGEKILETWTDVCPHCGLRFPSFEHLSGHMNVCIESSDLTIKEELIQTESEMQMESILPDDNGQEELITGDL